VSNACSHAHEIISMAYDGENVTAEDLRQAKAHCTTCAECAAFVSGLAKVRQVAAPKAPETAIDRAMVAVKREADTIAAAAAKADRDAAEGVAADATDAPAPKRPNQTWVTWGGWAAAAAAIVVAVGVITVSGVRYLSAPPDQVTSESASTAQDQTFEAAPAAPDAGSAEMSQDSASKSLSRAQTPDYVLFQGFVYTVSDETQSLPQDAARIGSLTSDLGSGTVAEHAVYASETPGTVLVAVDDRTALPAMALVRKLDGASYGLMSASFTEYGVWPALPAGMSQPATDDGSPVFEAAGDDDSGVPIFALTDTEPLTGFAVGPNTESSDPAGGNPSWTWWSPLN